MSESNGDRGHSQEVARGPDHTRVLSVLVRLSILGIHWKVLNKQDMIFPNRSFFIQLIYVTQAYLSKERWKP